MSNVRQYNITIPTGAATTDTTILNGITCTSLHFIKTNANGGGGDTIQLSKVSNADPPVVTAISNAVSLNVNDQVTVGPNAIQIDDASYVIGATDTIRFVTVQGGSDVACQALVTGIPNIS